MILRNTSMEGKERQVNMGKTKVLINLRRPTRTPAPRVSRPLLQTQFSVEVVPIGSTRDAGTHIQLQVETMHWTARPNRWQINDRDNCGEKLEVVSPFCYLGDCWSSGGGCKLASVTRCHFARGKFNELLPIPTSCSFPITPKIRVFNACARGAMRTN